MISHAFCAAIFTCIFACAAAQAQTPAPTAGASPVDAPLPPTTLAAPAGAPPPAVPPTTPPSSAQLVGSAAWDKLVGSTIIGRNVDGESYSAYFDAGGTLKEDDGHDVREGKWSAENGGVCFQYAADSRRDCYTVTLQGTVATLTDDKGRQNRYEVQPGDVKRF